MSDAPAAEEPPPSWTRIDLTSAAGSGTEVGVDVHHTSTLPSGSYSNPEMAVSMWDVTDGSSGLKIRLDLEAADKTERHVQIDAAPGAQLKVSAFNKGKGKGSGVAGMREVPLAPLSVWQRLRCRSRSRSDLRVVVVPAQRLPSAG